MSGFDSVLGIEVWIYSDLFITVSETRKSKSLKLLPKESTSYSWKITKCLTNTRPFLSFT